MQCTQWVIWEADADMLPHMEQCLGEGITLNGCDSLNTAV